MEMNDLDGNPDFAEVKKELITKLKKQQELMDDTLDLHTFFPELF
jgi:hypothetical protein